MVATTVAVLLDTLTVRAGAWRTPRRLTGTAARSPHAQRRSSDLAALSSIRFVPHARRVCVRGYWTPHFSGDVHARSGLCVSVRAHGVAERRPGTADDLASGVDRRSAAHSPPSRRQPAGRRRPANARRRRRPCLRPWCRPATTAAAIHCRAPASARSRPRTLAWRSCRICRTAASGTCGLPCRTRG